MKRFFIFLCSLIITLSSFAYNFGGKTFKGTETIPGGGKISVTMSFRTDGHATGSYTYGGKTKTGKLLWEVSGDYINLYEPATGDQSYLGIDYDGNNVYLIFYDNYGNEAMYLYPSASGSSSSKKSSSKKRK
ncbi:MAG: hypothetical protein K2M31_01055 [Muribaculaceae bacterium]|nr:hypothetical protein [Muribaculaceae bacterium]